jgi:hypothetical protein
MYDTPTHDKYSNDVEYIEEDIGETEYIDEYE